MGTNYYARILPGIAERSNLIRLVEKNGDFDDIVDTAMNLYGRVSEINEWGIFGTRINGGQVHLGKSSGGWKFLWNPNIYWHWIDGGDKGEIREPLYVYPLTREGIRRFLSRPDVLVFDEYGDGQDKEEFFGMATSDGGLDYDGYHAGHPEERMLAVKTSYTDWLEQLGYRLSRNKSEFYSDGLRFSASTNFG